MTKVELIATLESKYYKVLTPILQETKGGINKYVITCYKMDTDALSTVNVNFYVEDEGGPSEAAYWQTSEPTTDPTFTDQVIDYISNKIAGGAIEAGFILDISEDDETATGYAYIESAGEIKEKKVLIDKDQGVLRHRVIL